MCLTVSLGGSTQIRSPCLPALWCHSGSDANKALLVLFAWNRKRRVRNHNDGANKQRGSEQHRGNSLSCRAITSTLSQRLLHKMTNSSAVLIARLHARQRSKLSLDTYWYVSSMHLAQHELSTKETELALEVKFHQDVHWVYMAMAMNADPLKWRQIRVSAVSIRTFKESRPDTRNSRLPPSSLTTGSPQAHPFVL